MTRVKICGLCRPQDVELALSLGADAVGFVLEPTSKRCVTEAEASELARLAGPYATTVAVYGAAFGGLVPNIRAYQATLFPQDWPAPNWDRILAIRLVPGASMSSLPGGGYSGALHLDAFVAGSYGGTGHKVDWDLAAEIVENYPGPVILAGGLTPDNVAEAITKVRPHAVDLSTGVESSLRIKDPVKLRDFMCAVKGS